MTERGTEATTFSEAVTEAFSPTDSVNEAVASAYGGP